MRSFIKNMALVTEIFSPPIFIAVVLALFMISPVYERKNKRAMKERKEETTRPAQKGADLNIYETVCS